MDKSTGAALSGAAFLFVGSAVMVAAWVTHVVWIVKALGAAAGATTGQMLLGALGTFVPPVGVIHGLVLWFN